MAYLRMREYYKKVMDSVREWVDSEEMREFGRLARIRYYRDGIRRLSEEAEQLTARYRELREDKANEWALPILSERMEKIQKMISRNKHAVKAHKEGRKADVTDLMIERAREYPIEQIVEAGRSKRAKCPFHQGEHENLDIRKNFAYCYVCGESGDAIDVYRALHGVNFKEAVKALQ